MKFHGRIPAWQRNEGWFTTLPPKIHSVRKAKRWCDDNGSMTGRYYYHYTNTRWWFEYEKDAVWFSLHWSGK